jgi:hypothetical protein
METRFFIQLNLKTPDGIERYAKFYLGNDRAFADRLFRKLKGQEQIDDGNVLQLEYMETVNGLPINIKMRSCTLEDLAENCKIVTMETFKRLNMHKKQ